MNINKIYNKALILLAIVLFFAVSITAVLACEPTPTPTKVPEPTKVPCPTETPKPTEAPEPTKTPTITPTEAPVPTAVPTETPSNPSSGGGSSGGSSGPSACTPSIITTIPTIIQSKRINATTISISWGPYAGLNTFIVQYGFQKDKLQFNTKVTGFSTNINSLPANQQIFVQVAATDNCVIGSFGPVVRIGGGEVLGASLPALPGTGFEPDNFSNTALITGITSILSLSVLLIKRKKILSK
jgi:hypothetical protein